MAAGPYLGVDEVRATVDRRLTRGWRAEVLRGGLFPHRVSLRLPGAMALAADFATVASTSRDVRRAARDWGCAVDDVVRSVGGTRQRLASAVVIPDADTAARVAGGDWAATLQSAGVRAVALRLDTVDEAVAESVLGRTRGWPDEDVAILRRAADWFMANGPAPDLTARAVPVAGMHAKWLDRHASLVQLLTGLPDLGLAQRPIDVLVNHLDPDYRAAGRPQLVGIVAGHAPRPPYEVTAVIVIENRDCLDMCPPIRGAVAVWGGGNAAVAHLEALPWLATVPRFLYWGDIDAEGFAILARVRAAHGRPDRPVHSVLMDRAARDSRRGIGTNRYPDGREIPRGRGGLVVGLTPAEKDLLDEITDPGYTGYLRFEQEQLDPAVIAEALRAAVANDPC